MLSTLFSVILLGSSLVSSAPVSSNQPNAIFGRELEERGSCNADNLLRLLRTPTNLPEALPFCKTYLSLPTAGATVIIGTTTRTVTGATVTPTVTAIVTGTTTYINTIYLTSTSFDVNKQTITNIQTSTITTTSLVVVTNTVQAVLGKRRVQDPLSFQVTASYPESRISSACLCLTIPVDTVSITASTDIPATATAPVVTKTSLTAEIKQTTTSTTQISIIPTTTSITTTLLSSTTTTSFTTSTTLSIAPPAVPTTWVIQVAGRGLDGYLKPLTSSPTTSELIHAPYLFEAQTFTWEPSTHILSYVTPTNTNVMKSFVSPSNLNTLTKITLGAPSFMTCLAAGNCIIEQWAVDPYSLALSLPTPGRTTAPGFALCTSAAGWTLYVAPGGLMYGGCVNVSLTAVPITWA